MKAVAIDGPSGAGKSTIARTAANQLGFIYVDTGALYRTVGYYMVQNEISLEDEQAVKQALKGASVRFGYDETGLQRVYLNDRDVSDEIRTPLMSMTASKVSAIPAVRAFLLDLQREISHTNSVIMDGRDIGTVVLPDADVKIFLTASPEIRAKRRYDELCAKGERVSFEEVLQDVIERDYNDTHRAIAPLKQAEDAVLLDTGKLDFNESVQAVLKLIGEV